MFTFQSGFSPFLNFTSPLHFLSATLSLTPSFPPPIENSTLQIYQYIKRQVLETLLATCRQQDALALTRYRYLFVGALGLTVSGWVEVWSSSSFAMLRWGTTCFNVFAYMRNRLAESPFYCALRMRTYTCWVMSYNSTYVYAIRMSSLVPRPFLYGKGLGTELMIITLHPRRLLESSYL